MPFATVRSHLASARVGRHAAGMDLDALLYHYFGTADLDAVAPETLQSGSERVAIAFGTEREPGRRFALWALLHALGEAPDPAVAFKAQRDRDAALAYARIMARVGEDD